MNVTFKGITGNWNEKTYSSNKSDFRIYISSKEFHVTSAELEEIKTTLQPAAKQVAEGGMYILSDRKEKYWNGKVYYAETEGCVRIYVDRKPHCITLDELNELITQHTKAEDKVDMTDVIDVKDGYTKMIELDGIEKEWDGTLYIMSNLTRMIKVDGKEYKFSGRQFQKLISESNERHPEQTVE